MYSGKWWFIILVLVAAGSAATPLRIRYPLSVIGVWWIFVLVTYGQLDTLIEFPELELRRTLLPVTGIAIGAALTIAAAKGIRVAIIQNQSLLIQVFDRLREQFIANRNTIARDVAITSGVVAVLYFLARLLFDFRL